MSDSQEILLRLEQAFRLARNDEYAEAEYLIAACQDVPDINDLAFRAAIRAGAIAYVERHKAEINLNDAFGASTYLYETADRTMRNYLIDSGAFVSYDYYSGCRLAIESVGWDIIVWDAAFQREIFAAYLDYLQLDEEQLLALFNEQQELARRQYELQKQHFQEQHADEVNNSKTKAVSEAADESDAEYIIQVSFKMSDGRKRDLAADAHCLGFAVKDGALSFIDLEFEPCPRTKELLEELGYEFEFEGRQGKQQKIGVYFIA